jgi:type I restriction enzyme M protein
MARRQAAQANAIPPSGEILAAIDRGVIELRENRIKYNLKHAREYDWSNPEELVRAQTIAWLVIRKNYPAARMRTEVVVPRRVPEDKADVVVYRDDRCVDPYLVVENKAVNVTLAQRVQGIEQGFGNANSLRAALLLYDDGLESRVYNVADFPAGEREHNRLGTRDALPSQYGVIPTYRYVAGGLEDIQAVPTTALESLVRRAHSTIWAGGRRDPLTAFDEWSKLLFAKVMCERTTPNGQPRPFQRGTNETDAAVANKVHELFRGACRSDPSIFSQDTKIRLPDQKVAAVVELLQGVSFTRTDVDTIGAAFEHFFGSVFRGDLGQYFTRRELARFTVAMLDVAPADFVIDPTAGSGGFLLEALLQTWHRIDREYAGQPQRERLKLDFAAAHVYGVEIHTTLARICKINLLLHHDGHTNIEADRTCLDSEFSLPRLNPPQARFSVVVGNPPFGDTVEAGSEDHLGNNELANFEIAAGRDQVDSEHVILERAIKLLESGGRLGFVVPDGMLNNQGLQSNCPQVRQMLARNGRILAVISLPDYAFRKSGAQNKTSILIFQRYDPGDMQSLEDALADVQDEHQREHIEEDALDPSVAIARAYERAQMNYRVFLAEANWVGYSPAGVAADRNDLYRCDAAGRINDDQEGTVLGEYHRFRANQGQYETRSSPDCLAIDFLSLWTAHESNRLDPKYHLLKTQESLVAPAGWLKLPLRRVMERRLEEINPADRPNDPVVVMTLSQTGEIRPRAAGKGRNPPDWLGMYFADSPSTWHVAHAGDVVYSSIDLWKGCIALVPEQFEGALVTKEFPIYRVINERVSPEFLSVLLRSRFYQRAFRAITTGHSNRRRTQQLDFERLEIAFPPDPQEQLRLIEGIHRARHERRMATDALAQEQAVFDNLIDGRGNEALPEIEVADTEAAENGES